MWIRLAALLCVSAALASAPLPAAASPPGQDVGALRAQLSSADAAQRARAACALRDRGEESVAAMGALVALLDDGSPVDPAVCGRSWGPFGGAVRTTPGEQAAAALVAIGSPAYESLVEATRRPSWIARRNAAWGLGALDDRRAGSVVGPLMRDTEGAVREQAAWALGALDERDAVPALIAALKDEHAGVRSQAAWALGAIGDSRAVPALLHALKDPEPSVRRQAAWAVGAIGG